MSSLLARVRHHAAKHALWTPPTPVAVAVSGGSDSVALLFLLRELARAGDLRLAGLVHLHHHVRAEAADEDAQFCRDLAARTGVTAVVGDADVPAIALREHLSIEVAGRQARQVFFEEACASLGAQRVAVAHTQDDQAETVLLHLVRGAGPTGLGGMSPRIGDRVRPVLEVSREELRAYLRVRGEAWREDATNDDCANPRNRVRHEVLPLLRDKFNPRVTAALARTADILRADAQYLDAAAREADRLISSPNEAGVIIDAAGLAGLPVPIARRVAIRALETANPAHSYGLEEADILCAAASGSAVRNLRGIRMERSGALVVLTNTGGPAGLGGSSGSDESPSLSEAPPETLAIPGTARGPRGHWAVMAEGPMAAPAWGAGGRMAGVAGGPARVVVDADSLGAGLIVRGRRPGDRLRPLGLGGQKKVQDVFVDRKVPRSERDFVPVVTDTTGRIVWVAGHVLAEGFRVTPLTTTVVVLTLRR